MATFLDLPVDQRLNTKLKHSEFGVTHRIDEFFETKSFSDGFALTDETKRKLGVIAGALHETFFEHEQNAPTDISHEPYYFACAVTSLIECRPRMLFTESKETSSVDEPQFDKLDAFVHFYLTKNPYVDSLIATYADKMGGEHPENHSDAFKMTFPRLLSGLTFFLLESENADEYIIQRGIVRSQAIIDQSLRSK